MGRVNGLAVLGANSGLSDFSGIMLPAEALVTPSQGGGKIHATGGLSDLAKESVTNVSAVIKSQLEKTFQTMTFTSSLSIPMVSMVIQHQ